MLSYLQKFNDLPAEIKAAVSAPEVIGAINELEKRYNISLATVVMRVMIKDIAILDLAQFFVFEYSFEKKEAENLVEELKEKVFFTLKDYLGIKGEEPEGTAGSEDEDSAEPAIQRSSFFFSSEDEEEVRALAKKLQTYKKEVGLGPSAPPAIDFNQVIDKTAMEAGVSFGSEDLKNRFRQIVATYLKGVRNKIDAKSALTKDTLSGGLGMKDIFADNVILLVEKNKLEAEENALKNPLPAPQPGNSSSSGPGREFEHGLGASRDVAYDFNALKGKNSDSTPPAGKPLSFKLEDIKKAESFKAEKPALETVPPPPAPAAPPAPRPAAAGRKTVRPAEEPGQGKVRMQDVKYVPKLTGPIDELGEMDIVNFRRLSADPALAAGKIKEKLEFLEGESYSQRLKGIEAWRQSPLNKMYLGAGNESLGNNVPVGDVLSKKQQTEENAMSLKEFHAIMQLNKDLRF